MRPDDLVVRHRRVGRRRRAPATTVAMIVVGVLVAGCGGGVKSPGVANVSTSTTSSSHSSSSSTVTTAAAGTALSGGGPSNGSGGTGGARSGFAIADREPAAGAQALGVHARERRAELPRPQRPGRDPGQRASIRTRRRSSGPSRRAPRSSAVAWRRSPAQHAQAEAAALAFSKCMRSHGVSDFPDPQFGSGGAIRISAPRSVASSSGLDPNSPIFQKAQKTCGSLLPGRAGKTAAP